MGQRTTNYPGHPSYFGTAHCCPAEQLESSWSGGDPQMVPSYSTVVVKARKMFAKKNDEPPF